MKNPRFMMNRGFNVVSSDIEIYLDILELMHPAGG